METLRVDRRANTSTNLIEKMVENSEISQVTNEQCQYIKHTPKSGEILPKQQGEDRKKHTTPKVSEILPKEMHQVTDLEAMQERAITRTPTQEAREKLTQMQHTPRSGNITEVASIKEQESPQ